MNDLTVGLGCDRGTPLATMLDALNLALQSIGRSPEQIQLCATISAKADEIALLDLTQHLNVPLRFFSAAELAKVPGANPSATVMHYMGTPSVSEAAALLAAQMSGENRPGSAHLLLEKFKHRGACGKNATISIAKIPS